MTAENSIVALSNSTVLVAEDETPLRELIGVWLEDTGLHVVFAGDGLEALEAVDRDVDILVCDRRMPRMNGEQVIEQLDETGFAGTVIALTACEPDAVLGEADVDVYLQKPVTRDELRDVVMSIEA